MILSSLSDSELQPSQLREEKQPYSLRAQPFRYPLNVFVLQNHTSLLLFFRGVVVEEFLSLIKIFTRHKADVWVGQGGWREPILPF